MIAEIKIPSPGESISEVEIASWLVSDGDIVEKDQEIAEIESDKATLPLIATEAGKIKIEAPDGETIPVGAIACLIDTDFAGEVSSKAVEVIEPKPDKTTTKPEESVKTASSDKSYDKVKISPLAKQVMAENNFSIDDVLKGLKRITKRDVESVIEDSSTANRTPSFHENSPLSNRDIERKKMSSLRKKLSKRLVAVKSETAMLTTFNEVDMTEVISLRKKYQKKFIDKHDIKLGFMSFFIKAVSESLKLFPNVNSMLDADEIITPSYTDIGVAVQTPKGLMVPVIRDVNILGLAEIEKSLSELATKARAGRISLDDLTGGTFTVTNGGTFGSLLSTPILNPPQSGILGMHNIVERPVAIDGKVQIRPMMYLALSYDHRIIDGKDSVSFLVKVKEFIEKPELLLYNGLAPEQILLGL